MSAAKSPATPRQADLADDNLDREEDFRDYEERDIEDGWPYADESGAAGQPADNRPYGGAGANFDQDRNVGLRVENAEADGSEPALRSPVLPETDHREESDQLEADVTEVIEMLDDIVLEALDVHVDGRVVTLTGSVDTAEERRRVELAALDVAGVSQVINQLRTRGVDSHMPADLDE